MRTLDTKSPPTNLSRGDRLVLLLEREGNRRLRSLGTWLYRLTRGRMTPHHRHVVLLTTRGRKSGREHTVLLQSFPEGLNMLIVGTNSGGDTQPDWFANLKADPAARVESMGRTLQVRAEQLPADEAASFWPAILRHAPTYARYGKATNRTIPIVRLIPLG